jgi:hydrogenase maturation protease
VTYPDDTFARAGAIADSVLWEGYVLYPYRASAAKNRMRFQWGVVGAAEQPTMTTTVLVEHTRTAHVDVRLRFLHLARRDDGWDEAVDRAVDLSVELVDGAVVEHPVVVPADRPGQRPVEASLRTSVVRRGALTALRVDVVNHDADHDAGGAHGPRPAARDELLLSAMIGTHVLFATPVDAFVSLLEPPDWAAEAVAACVQERCWPVIVGPAPSRDLVLASPVILYDHPVVAPESPGDFFDGTEIDELLTLRVQTLTDEEKDEARRTDPRAAAIIDRCDDMSSDTLAALHGRLGSGSGDGPAAAEAAPSDPFPEWSDPGPRRVLVGGTWIGPGDKVRLRPGRRADAHDVFLAGRVATVGEIVHTVDGDSHVAVTVDDDPAAELMDWHGRYLYFDPDELEPEVGRRPDRGAGPGAVSGPHRRARVLIAGVGNIFAGDDGFGCAVAAHLLAEADLPAGVRVVDYGIRGVHLAFDLADVETLILVDTVPDAGGPGSVEILEVDPATALDERAAGTAPPAAVDAHSMDPDHVLRSVVALGAAMPRTLLVGCEPENLDDGIGLGPLVAAAVPVAAATALELARRELDSLKGTP